MIDAAAAARQWACQQQLVRFFALLDAGRYEELVGLFEPAAVWHRPGGVVQGHAGIRAAMNERPAQRATRHLVANFLVTHDDGSLVQATCALSTHAIDAPKEGSMPALAQAMVGLFRARTSMSAGDGQPRIRQLELAPDWIFQRQA